LTLRYGRFSTLPKKISELVACRSIPDLLHAMLGRMEANFVHAETQQAGHRLVRAALVIIACSRAGIMVETELRELLGLEGTQYGLLWATFYFTLKPLLMLRSGRATFLHDYVRTAVNQRYLAKSEERRQVHGILAHYFMGTAMATGAASTPALDGVASLGTIDSSGVGDEPAAAGTVGVSGTASSQPLRFLSSGLPNSRKVVELPYHLLHAEMVS